jgi:hypothetical protein
MRMVLTSSGFAELPERMEISYSPAVRSESIIIIILLLLFHIPHNLPDD